MDTRVRQALALEAAVSIITVPGQWTRGELARDAEGNDVPVDSPDAASFCFMGGLERVAMLTPDEQLDLEACIEDAIEDRYPSCVPVCIHQITEVNDQLGLDAVVEIARSVAEDLCRADR